MSIYDGFIYTGLNAQNNILADNSIKIVADNVNVIGNTSVTITCNGSVSLAGLVYPMTDGTNGQALVTDGAGNLSFATVGAGNVSGPGSSTDNALVRWDGTGGATLQNSVVTVSDLGAVAGVTSLTTSGNITNGTVTISGGALSGVTNLTGSGTIQGGTVTDGTASITSGAISGVTTLTTSGNITNGTVLISGGAISGVTTLTTSGNITNGTVTISGGALSGVTNLTGSGTIQGGTVTDGTASITSGAISGVTTLTTSGNITNGTITLASGAINGATSLNMTGYLLVNNGGNNRVNVRVPFAYSYSSSLQELNNNATITLNNVALELVDVISTNKTGIRMPSGTVDGDIRMISNLSGSQSFSWDVLGTSLVAWKSTQQTVAAGVTQMLIWRSPYWWVISDSAY